MKKTSISQLRFFAVSLVFASILFHTGCAIYMGLRRDSEALLKEPNSLPPPPDLSTEFADYRDVPVLIDLEPFAETVRATDMGYIGVPRCVGLYPLRAIAGRGLRALVEKHFRVPAYGEHPVIALETIPKNLSVQQDGRMARVSFSVAIRCVKQDEARTVLLANTYTGTRVGHWQDPTVVPISVYDALNDIWSAFLADFLRKVPAGFFDMHVGKKNETPVLGDLSFLSAKGADGAVRITGSCSVACNGLEATEAAEWAHQRILSLCAGHLGVEESHTGVRYDDGKTCYDKALDTWTFVFSTWARTRMSMQYDSASRRGRVVVDLDLFEDPVETATEEAAKFIVREMNRRAGIYAEDAPKAIADIQFGTIVTDAEHRELVLPFSLVY